MWRCVNVEMWRCVNVEMCRCGSVNVEMWRCVDVEMWRFGVKDAAKLCLWLVEVLRYKTKKLSVKRILLYSLLFL